MSPQFQNLKSAGSKRSSALVITLVVLVLVTLLVVSLSSMIALERNSTHESFENQRAREFSTIAVDEVVALLHDSIPTNSMWAAAPGKIEFFPTPTSATTTTVPLYSGQATGPAASTGQVDLNAPVLGASISTYPIISTNAEYPSATPMPMGWIEVLQDGTMVRPGSASSKDANNPVVGRYAYWVDTETSKANINTAGKGQTTYTFNAATFATNGAGNNDLQNLTASPSRLDLSLLDGGITPAQSMGTYHYTYGGNWMPTGAGDYLGAPIYATNTGSLGPLTFPFGIPAVPTNAAGGTSQGLRRFSTIQDWSQMTNDVITGATVTALTAAQVEQNKFYLTTRSSAPDVTPWGFNKLWLQSTPVNSTNAYSATYGNKINGKGAPMYPASVNVAQTNSPPSTINFRGIASRVSDNRYYETPFLTNGANPGTDNFQFAGQYDADYNRTTAFMNAMMVQLNRTDWPGFNGQSFVGKYGQAECEDLAFNMLCLYDSAIHGGGLAPSLYTGRPQTNASTDVYGYYGGCAQYTLNGRPTRLFSGVGQWPYLTQVSATFAPAGTVGSDQVAWTNSPKTILNATNVSPYSGYLTNSYPSPATNVVIYYTKIAVSSGGGSIGFVPSWPASLPTVSGTTTSSKQPVNIKITPSVQVYYPPGFKNPYVENAAGSPWIVDIAVSATGIYKGATVTYGTTTTDDTAEPLPANNKTYHPYYWGVLDQNFTTISTITNPLPPPAPTLATNTTIGQGVAAKGRPFWTPPALGSIITSTTASTGSPAGYMTITFPDIFIGPFDQSTQITSAQLRCRFLLARENGRGLNCATEIAPLAYNAASPTSAANEDACFVNVMNSNAPTFLFDSTYAGSPLNTGTATTLPDPTVRRDVTYEVIDPRVYRYLSDWTKRRGALQTNAPPSIYVNSYADGLTGVKGDASKLAWPDVGGNYFNWSLGLNGGTGVYVNTSANSGDVRLLQNANNIVGFPGIGWLSVLPLNCESSQGSVASGKGSGDPANPGKPVPWRTLSLEPTPTSNGLQAGGKIPDWLLLEAFAVAYDQTFCSQTEGKLNINAAIGPQFPSGTTIPPRTKPLQALIAPANYPTTSTTDLPALNAATIAADIAKGQSGSTYSAPYGAVGLPTDILMYPGQLCQFSSMAGTGGTANTQWQRESLMRSLAGVVTTQCSDFKVHVVAQAVKQVAFNGNPISDFVVTGEQRMSAIVSRATNLGPDNLPDTSDDPVQTTLITPASFTPGSASPNTGILTMLTNGTPSFKYVISDVNYVNN